ncbi:MAG: hypothetical protein OES13_04190 [Acidimicrobiia bacterium]|nr:hypothetical protein [Acidimicrobiia bacterium]
MTDLRIRETAAPQDRLTEKERREQVWEDWWTSDRLDAFGWAALFLWGALVLMAQLTSFKDDYDRWEGWGVFFVGAGVIVLLEAAVRLPIPKYRSKFGWTLFWGTAFLAIGLGELANPAWYALPLAAIAVVILKDALTRRE